MLVRGEHPALFSYSPLRLFEKTPNTSMHREKGQNMNSHLNATYHCAGPREGVTGLCVLLHGLGANGADLMSIGQLWSQSLPHTAFFAPDAPEPFMPFETGGYRWFDLHDPDPQARIEGMRQSAKLLKEFLEGLLEEFGLTHERLVLMGFSQGAAMALHVGPREGHPVMGYSGGIFLQEPHPIFKQVPILLVHGTADEVLPLGYMEEAQAYLSHHGLEALTLICQGLGHGIDEAGLQAGLAFLQNTTHLS